MEQQTVHLFVFDTLSDWEPGFAIAGINNPAWQAQPGRYRVRTVGVGREPVTTVGGVTILPDLALAELTPAESAMLILTGGAGWETGEHAEAVDTARVFLAAGVPVAAICGATAGLARTGLLDDHNHTSNAAAYLHATGYRGAARYREEPAMTDGDLITAGATAPVDFAYHIFRRLEVYTAAILEAWYGLYKTGEAAYFFRLQELAAGAAANSATAAAG